MGKPWPRCWVVFVLVAFCAVSPEAGAKEVFNSAKARAATFGITPWLKSSVTHIWSRSVQEWLLKVACLDVRFKSAESYESYLRVAIEGQFDVVDVPAHMAALLIQDYGYSPLVYEQLVKAIAVVSRPGEKTLQLDDLTDKSFGLPDQLALVSLVVQEKYHQLGVKSPEFIHFRGHDRVLEAIIKGEVVAGAVVDPLFEKYIEAEKNNFKS